MKLCLLWRCQGATWKLVRVDEHCESCYRHTKNSDYRTVTVESAREDYGVRVP